jgi:hypothetical protein
VLQKRLSCNLRPKVIKTERAMLVHTACEALRSGHVLELRYDGFSRCVEVRAVGFSDDDNLITRVWQVSGGKAGNEPAGWKLLRLDEAAGAVVTGQKSLAPRPDNKPGDEAMKTIACQL